MASHPITTAKNVLIVELMDYLGFVPGNYRDGLLASIRQNLRHGYSLQQSVDKVLGEGSWDLFLAEWTE